MYFVDCTYIHTAPLHFTSLHLTRKTLSALGCPRSGEANHAKTTLHTPCITQFHGRHGAILSLDVYEKTLYIMQCC